MIRFITIYYYIVSRAYAQFPFGEDNGKKCKYDRIRIFILVHSSFFYFRIVSMIAS